VPTRTTSTLPRRARRWTALALAVTLVTIAGCGGRGPGADRPGHLSAGTMPASANTEGAGAVELPPVAGRFSYQLGGAYPPPAGVSIVDRDHSAPAAPGRYSICYLNAYQAQPDQLSWWTSYHPDLLLHDQHGSPVIDTQWNEALFDISTPDKRHTLATVVDGWINGCATAGFQAIEADNLDSYTRSRHLLTASDALAYAAAFVGHAHQHRLAVAQKNAAELTDRARQIGFDFAIAEECQVYAECAAYTAAYGSHLIEIEYTDQPLAAFTTACTLRAHTASVVLRDRDLTPPGDPNHVERWCP
jgi:hypothetical protein